MQMIYKNCIINQTNNKTLKAYVKYLLKHITQIN